MPFSPPPPGHRSRCGSRTKREWVKRARSRISGRRSARGHGWYAINRHDSAYLFGAICPARAVGAAIIMPAANAEAMNEHLSEISTQVASGAHAVVVCDKAGWHQTGRRLRVPDNITLLPLPSYAPELNPMENVWEYLRGNKLSRLVW